MELSATLQEKIIDFLVSFLNFDNTDSQQAFINHTGIDEELQQQISFGKPPLEFVSLLLPKLIKYGKLKDGRDPIVAILETAKGYVGQDRKAQCDKILRELSINPDHEEQTKEMVLRNINKLEKLADEIENLGKKLLQKAPIKEKENVVGSLVSPPHRSYRPSLPYTFRADPPPKTYMSYHWGILNDELKKLQSEVIGKYQSFYSSACKYIKRYLYDRESEFAGYYKRILQELQLKSFLYNDNRLLIIQEFEENFMVQKDILLSVKYLVEINNS